MLFYDWTPLDLKPGEDLPDATRDDLRRARPAAAPTGLRNGMPAPVPYAYGARDRARDAEVAARLAAVRAEVQRREDAGLPLLDWAGMIREVPPEPAAPRPRGPVRRPAASLPSPAPLPAPEPEPAVPAPEWCEVCGYRMTALGHRLECGTDG